MHDPAGKGVGIVLCRSLRERGVLRAENQPRALRHGRIGLDRDFEAAISDPAVALRVIRMLSVKLHDSNERNLILSTSDPQARIAAFLLYRQQRTAAKYVTLRLDDIASSVNLRPETVSRKLRELEKDGLIRKTGQSNIELLDFIRLKEMAEG